MRRAVEHQPQRSDSPAVNVLQRLIKDRAAERGMSLGAVATKAKMNRQTLYDLMSEDRAPTMPRRQTLAKIAKALDLPDRVLVQAATEVAGLRTYDEPVTDPDTRVVIATMEQLPPARRREIREMTELLARRYLGEEA